MFRTLLPESVIVIETRGAIEVADLHPDEAACVQAAVLKRRREFSAGRACARRALAELGIADFPLLPDADRAPIWPPGIVGSISHCAGHVGAAVARRDTITGLGMDVEVANPLDETLVPRICTPEERARLERLPRRAHVDWHMLVFSAKESVYKAYYPLTRSWLGFHDVELVVDPDAEAFAATLIRPDAPAAAEVRTFRGRYACNGEHIFTAVAFSAADRREP